MPVNVDVFLSRYNNFDIRENHDARFCDQKCTPDIVCFIADCILSTRCANAEFTINDLWDEPYFIENCRVIFGKPSPTDPSARNEYNKVLCQPLKTLAYAHVLNVRKDGRALYFSVNDAEVLDYIALRERNAYNFMYTFFMRVIADSGIMRFFDEYRENCQLIDIKEARTIIYQKYHRFISGNTPAKSKTDLDRMFHKVFNVYAYHEMLPGSKGKELTWQDLLYNRLNARDLGHKRKSQTRSEGRAAEFAEINQDFYITYQVNKAIRYVRRRQGNESEVHDDLALGRATEVHHIFSKSQFPELATRFENLILLTSSQHRQRAHPNSNFQIVDREYQLICLMAKSRTVEDDIIAHGEEFYSKQSFIFVVNTGTGREILQNEDSFNDIRRIIHGLYNDDPYVVPESENLAENQPIQLNFIVQLAAEPDNTFN